MNIISFSSDLSSKTKSFVLGVLADEGFAYDPLKDFDLDDIGGNYLRAGGAFFISLHDGKVVGTSAVRCLDSDSCEIKRLYVKNECRGKGLGLALFRKALDFAERNYSSIQLKTDSSLEKAISMYLRHDFIVIKEENGTVYFERSV
ncbi:GNAT family N-acetyltransferase [Methanolobus sp. ZRKC4]|uniref:GNAT family N-acetyltransferase n=1 Tax=Methanolobus sp. ZRKC4 TaxID=3125787 RepID=UPI0032548546